MSFQATAAMDLYSLIVPKKRASIIPRGCQEHGCSLTPSRGANTGYIMLCHHQPQIGVSTYYTISNEKIADLELDLWADDVKPWLVSLHEEMPA